MPKIILISQVSLPFSGIGSWTTLYKNYLEANHQIDYLICVQPDCQFPNVAYKFVRTNFISKIEKKLSKSNYELYLKEIKKIITNSNDKFIIQIIDNHGLVNPLQKFLLKYNFRKKCYIQFFYHGFPPFHDNFQGRGFYEAVDEMIVLTLDSYKAHKDYYTILPCRFSVLHNGIDTSMFYKISELEKLKLKVALDFKANKTFIWCSQDRPKKGLSIILDAWKRIYKNNQNLELIVIGTENKPEIKGIKFLGKIPNDALPKYFQASDVFLFPVLNHEGFGLSLIEALHCGNYCIASSTGGVPEVLQYGKLGKLIENPNMVSQWVDAIDDYLTHNLSFPSISKNLYSTQSWIAGMNQIITQAKESLID